LRGYHANCDLSDDQLIRRDATAFADREGRAGEETIANPQGSLCGTIQVAPVAPNGRGGGGGGYIGFRRFSAMISKGPKGDYNEGRIEHVEGIPVTSGGSNTEEDTVETGLIEDNCKSWGYPDFNGVN
jgi:hypothetical protein